MAIFVAASDESDGPLQRGPFVYGGFVGPTRDWIDWFARAWEERVLNGKPPLEYFHMATIRSRRWQAKHGWTVMDAERRIDEAVNVVASMGSLHLVRTSLDGGHFRQVFGKARVIRKGQPGMYAFDPDYVGFLGFARGVLEYVQAHDPNADCVDFMVERKSRVTHYFPDYLDSLKEWLIAQQKPELAALVGDVIPVSKHLVPVQAADLALWHIRRHEAGESGAADVRRLTQMFHDRTMTITGMTNDEISTVGNRIAARRHVSPFTPKNNTQ